ncbi:prepilin-type N-terminal cleavage/methylation domain-containing protein [Thermobrachium celere]|uniref:prepilin-type N-terminal cleavage/methylation domain-containing protein n=1 Tax=Thermobrachium celere TaxID=53422 RepID=UPI0019413503|nr:prepilin-type N-terminal cleavage/methylation domain-containing protein [Thermobrachium celere]GFR36407.1 hypothetical protein TCEA9_22190 [Thermobrachium celere]
MKKQKGYTLIEVVCTIAIMMLSFSIISLNIEIFNHFYLQQTVDLVIADLQEAKMLAINNGIYDINVYFTQDSSQKDYDGYIVYRSDGKVIKNRKLNHYFSISRIKSTIPIEGKIIFKTNGSVSPHACTVAIYDKKKRTI